MKTAAKSISIALMVTVSSTIFAGCDHQKAATIGGVLGGIGALGGGLAAIVSSMKDTSTSNNITIKIDKGDENNSKSKEETNTKKSESIVESNTNDKNNLKSETDKDRRENIQKIEEPKKNTSAQNVSKIEYKTFEDKAFKFSFNYPVKFEKNFSKAESDRHNAFTHSIKLDNSMIFVGVDFADTANDVKRLTTVYSWIINVNMQQLDDGSYLLTYINKSSKEYHVHKMFFVKDDFENISHRFVEFVYGVDTTDEEKAIGQHIIDSFKPGN